MDTDALYERMVKQKARETCSVCDHRGVSTEMEPLGTFVTLALRPNEVVCLCLVCPNCAYVRLHSVGLLRKLDEQQG